MNEIKFECVHCRQHIACDESWAGRRVRCPACDAEITVIGSPHRALPDELSRTGLPKRKNPGSGAGWVIAGWVGAAIILLGLYQLKQAEAHPLSQIFDRETLINAGQSLASAKSLNPIGVVAKGDSIVMVSGSMRVSNGQMGLSAGDLVFNVDSEVVGINGISLQPRECAVVQDGKLEKIPDILEP